MFGVVGLGAGGGGRQEAGEPGGGLSHLSKGCCISKPYSTSSDFCYFYFLDNIGLHNHI